GQHYYSTPSSF
nr:immunoglobulin light chain junction region [Macaca mulatta]